MGARVYLPELGRFAQVDPIEGGTENNYVYPTDPVNEFDLTGMMCAPGGSSPYSFLSCKYNRSFEKYTRTAMKWTAIGAAVVGGAVIVGGACATIGASGCITAAASAGARAATLAKAKLRNGNNVFRVGKIAGKTRVSIGPAPGRYNQMPKWKKAISPIHIHIERGKVGIDLNWFGKSYYKSWGGK